VFKERLPRYSPQELRMGWSVHYNNFTRDEHNFIIQSRKLTKYNEDGNWNLTKTFDGSFGAWNPPSVTEKLSNLQTEIRRLEELNQSYREEIERLQSSYALQLARKVPFGAHMRKLLIPKGAGKSR
jgi:Mg2+ and Co2+ transporter CorA